MTANPAVRAEDLARLKAVDARWTTAIAQTCDQYVQERTAKETTERRARSSPESRWSGTVRTVFPGYQTAINVYLSRLNAGFRLDSVNYANTRGGPTCTYNVLINDTPSPRGPSRSHTGRTIVSKYAERRGPETPSPLRSSSLPRSGSRHSRSKIVVVDDPISSLDEHRSLATVTEVRRLGERTSQTIVLSHDKSFLCRLWKGADLQAPRPLRSFARRQVRRSEAWTCTTTRSRSTTSDTRRCSITLDNGPAIGGRSPGRYVRTSRRSCAWRASASSSPEH